MEYRSDLETLECFSNALARYCTHQVGVLVIFYSLVKDTESQELLIVMNKAPSSLLVDSYVCHIDGIHE